MNLEPLSDSEWKRLLERLRKVSIAQLQLEPDFLYGLVARLRMTEGTLIAALEVVEAAEVIDDKVNPDEADEERLWRALTTFRKLVPKEPLK